MAGNTQGAAAGASAGYAIGGPWGAAAGAVIGYFDDGPEYPPDVIVGTTHPGVDQARLRGDPFYAEAVHRAEQRHIELQGGRSWLHPNDIGGGTPIPAVQHDINEQLDILRSEGWKPSALPIGTSWSLGMDFGDNAYLNPTARGSAPSSAVAPDKTPASPPVIQGTPPITWIAIALVLGYLVMGG